MEHLLQAKPSSRNFMCVFLLKLYKNLGIIASWQIRKCSQMEYLFIHKQIHLPIRQLFFLHLLDIKHWARY